MEPTEPWPALQEEAEAEKSEVLKYARENSQQVMWVLTAYGRASSSSGPRPSAQPLLSSPPHSVSHIWIIHSRLQPSRSNLLPNRSVQIQCLNHHGMIHVYQRSQISQRVHHKNNWGHTCSLKCQPHGTAISVSYCVLSHVATSPSISLILQHYLGWKSKKTNCEMHRHICEKWLERF